MDVASRQTDATFYVVTVNYRSLDFLRTLVSSLEPVSGPKKLIIVDHSGEVSDESVHAKFPVKIVKSENNGYGAGLNRGLREIPDSDGLVFLCNPDVRLLTPERYRDVARYMENNPWIGALAPRIVTESGLNVSSCRRFYTLLTVLAVRVGAIVRRCPDFIEKHYYWDKGFETPFVADWASGAALFTRLSAFPDRKFFDERYFLYMEDVDFSARLWKRGWSIEYFPTFVVEHHEARRSRKDLKYLFMHVASLMKFIWKHKGFPSRDELQSSRQSVGDPKKSLGSRLKCLVTGITR